MKSPNVFRRILTCIEERRLPSKLTYFLEKLEDRLEIGGKKIVFCRHGKKPILFFKVKDLPGGDFMIRHVCYAKEHFPKFSSYLDFRINTYDTVIDIGAHLGFFSIYAANIAKGGRVYSFEPANQNFERLKYHQKINGLKNIIPVNKGISDKEEKTKLYIWRNLKHRNSMVFTDEGDMSNYELVDCIPLKRVFDEYKIEKCDFLKIDCEGLEEKILKALPDEYFRRIGKIALEYHPNVDILEVAKLLHDKNYKVIIIGYPRKSGSLFAVRNT